MAATAVVETVTETTLAAEQKGKLVKSLGRFDAVFFIVATIVGLDLIGQAASNGPEAFFWAIVLCVLFLIPYALVMAETGAAFPIEGGPYEWVKLTMGRFWGSLNTMFYWVTNPLWVGGSLAFIGTEAWSQGISGIGTGTFSDYLFKVVFIWLTIGSAIVSLKLGKWVPTLGAMVKVALVAFFAITVIIYAIDHGVHGGFAVSKMSPTSVGFLAIVPLILFSFVGFESANGAAEEMKDPQKDVPIAIFRSGVLSTFCYLVPIFLVLLVLPAKAITGLGGFLDAVQVSYGIYGGAASFLFGVTCILFIFTLMNSGSAWMMSGDRVLAVSAADGGFFPYFGVFNERVGTPIRANVLSGIMATAFMVAAVAVFNGGKDSTFGVVLDIAISTTLISYILMFPAAYILRLRHPNINRPFRIPGGNWVMLACSAVITFWVAVGSWSAVFPKTLNSLLGNSYSFKDEWGVTGTKFTAFTLGTLAVLTLISVLGYLSGAGVRRNTVEVAIAGPADAVVAAPA
jgi:amino acid transporter